MKPPPPPTPEQARELALAVVAADKFPMLASISADGRRPHVRPVSPVLTEEFTVWIASLRSSDKTAEIDANANVELCYLSSDHDQVRIAGVAATITDAAPRQRVWDANPLLRAYLKSVDNPEFVLYRVDPLRVRYMREWALDYHEVTPVSKPGPDTAP